MAGGDLDGDLYFSNLYIYNQLHGMKGSFSSATKIH